MDKIFLGNSPAIDHTYGISLSKHSWDCDWYWGFGCIGNSKLHTHVSCTFLNPEEYRNWIDVSFWFSSTFLTQKNWWEFLERFKTAYTLRAAADTISRGGSHITNASITADKELAKVLNKKLECLLDDTWNWLQQLKETQPEIAYTHSTRVQTC